MRVLHLDGGRSMRGGQYQVLFLLKNLPVESRLLAPGGSPLLTGARAEGFPADELNWRALRAESGGVDLVHCHDARAHTLAALWSRAPFVVSRRVAFPVKRGWLSRWKYGRAAGYLAVSECVKAELRAAGVRDERIVVVPDSTALPEEVSPRDGEIVAIASDDPGKGGELLRRSGLPVHFSSDLAADLRRARAFVYVSESEGLGSAALLAMAHGVPVVASRVGGLPEIVVHEETGLLIENSVEAVRAAVGRLEADAGLAARLAANGRALVERRFTMKHMVEGTLAAYRMALGVK
jgi:hypothetical protein